MNVCFETFGCRLNRAEALAEEAAYLAAGWKRVASHAEADVIVVRGCSVTAHAARDSRHLVEHLQRKYPTKRVVIEGCLPEATAHGDEITRIPGAPPTDAPFVVPTRTARAFLKVQDGCAGACTFCIVPKFRGASHSIPVAEVLDRARRFADAGYREIVVTGCNLALYAAGGLRLGGLIAALAEKVPEARFRLGSVEPGAVARELVEAMAERANVCRYLHLPVQSGSDDVLKAMNRPYRAADVFALAEAAAARVPGLVFGCDLMSGFPGERPRDHLATVSILDRIGFARAHVFPFSERPGTAAAKMPNAVPHGTRAAWARELSDEAERLRTRAAQRYREREVTIVVEDAAKTAGWTDEYFWCEGAAAAAATRPARKTLARIRVRSVAEGHLKGTLV